MDVDDAPNESEEQAQTADESIADEADSEDEALLPPSTRKVEKNDEGSSAKVPSSRAPPEDLPPPHKARLTIRKESSSSSEACTRSGRLRNTIK
jgi:hypothetical protein